MKERPLFTAAFVLWSPSLVPSLAARMSFCTCGAGGGGGGGRETCGGPRTPAPAPSLF